MVGATLTSKNMQKEDELPILMYCHPLQGGCWFFNSIDTFDAWLRRLASVGGFIIVSVDYRCASVLLSALLA